MSEWVGEAHTVLRYRHKASATQFPRTGPEGLWSHRPFLFEDCACVMARMNARNKKYGRRRGSETPDESHTSLGHALWKTKRKPSYLQDGHVRLVFTHPLSLSSGVQPPPSPPIAECPAPSY